VAKRKRICLQCRRCRVDAWVSKIPGKRKCNTLQYSCLGNPMDRGAWRATVHGVSKESNNLVTEEQQQIL